MRKKEDNSVRASALQIVLSTTLISVSAILLAAAAAPNNAKKAPRQVTPTGQSSGIAAPATFTPATPTPAPCGKIAFVSSRNGNGFLIYVMNADGSNQTRLTNNSANDGAPSFSGDGSKIAFSSGRDDGNLQIYVMNADGSNQTRLSQ